ncbi:DUF6980 family protein [Micromonospora vulcania]|uniref:DUF6980 family protein n=1 Tax=Micromonospora vulcania TaxID=1441873 RepID=A0ABW1H114_9ACTN
MTFCCEMMRDKVEAKCDQHADSFDCPDCLIYHDPDPRDERYVLIIHDGGSSYIAIRYCPWCGTSLPGDVDDEDDTTA